MLVLSQNVTRLRRQIGCDEDHTALRIRAEDEHFGEKVPDLSDGKIQNPQNLFAYELLW